MIALSAEIKAWVDSYGDKVNSPFMSEEVIGVYNYTKAAYGKSEGGRVTWQDVFADRLNPWRKLSL